MIRCNLSILLAERNIRITKLSNDTGISRTTLTYLANNYSKGVQFDTLNTLCSYLHVTPDDLISFIPIEIEHIYVSRSGDQLDISATITNKGISKECNFCGSVFLYPDKENAFPYSFDISLSLYDSDNDPDIEKENEFIRSTFNALPVSFLSDIENEITTDIIDDLEYEYGNPDPDIPLTVSFYWDNIFTKD